MNWNLVWAIVMRHMYNFRHSLDRVSDTFYWPAMDLLLWGFTSVFISRNSAAIPGIVLAILSGIILWMMVWRSQFEITVNLLEEMWSQNMVNLFATPLRVREWIMAVFILGLIKMVFSVGFAILLAFIVYKINIFSLGFYLIPFMVSLVLTGWSVGLFVASFIIYYGTRIQTIAWSGAALLSPFSGVFYPISVLPYWAQNLSMWLPTSYIFQGMREVVLKGTMSRDLLLMSFVINSIWFIIGLSFFVFMFDKSKKKGLARLE